MSRPVGGCQRCIAAGATWPGRADTSAAGGRRRLAVGSGVIASSASPADADHRQEPPALPPRPRARRSVLPRPRPRSHPSRRRGSSLPPSQVMSLIAAIVLLAISPSVSLARDCKPEDVTFELVTGFVFSSPQHIIDTKTGTLKLSECITACLENAACQSLNFETGLCVLFASNPDAQPGRGQSV